MKLVKRVNDDNFERHVTRYWGSISRVTQKDTSEARQTLAGYYLTFERIPQKYGKTLRDAFDVLELNQNTYEAGRLEAFVHSARETYAQIRDDLDDLELLPLQHPDDIDHDEDDLRSDLEHDIKHLEYLAEQSKIPKDEFWPKIVPDLNHFAVEQMKRRASAPLNVDQQPDIDPAP